MVRAFTLTNIVIEYGDFKVGGTTKAAPLLHAMRQGSPLTMCGRRPLRFIVKDPAGLSTTCPKCLEALASAAPKVEEIEPPKEPTFSRREPAVKQPKRMRCWVITEKGHAYLAALEKAERGE